MSSLSLPDLKELLEKAQNDLDAAKEKVALLEDQIAEVEDVLGERINYLNLPPADTADTTDTADEAAVETTTTTPTAALVIPSSEVPVLPVAAVTLPAAGVAGVRRTATRGIAAENGTAGYGEGNVLSGEELLTAGDDLNLNVKPASEKTSKKSTSLTKITDDDVALAAAPDEVNKNMNWWWLLLVALLGATGYKLYKKHEEKKNRLEVETKSL